MPEKKKTDTPPPTFEAALQRLETIVREMESGQLSLEQMMTGFEEGTGLVNLCTRKLNEVERKIELLLKQDEQLTTQPFTPPAGENE